MSNSKKEFTIVGAGLVGTLLAVGLKKMGHSVCLIEKRSDLRRASEDGYRSINLVVTSRGLLGLERVGLFEKIKDLVVPIEGRAIHSKLGEVVHQPYGKKDECNFSVSRSKLNAFLLDEAESLGIPIEFDASIEDLDFENQMISSSGERRHYEILIGTDGAGSFVRESLMEKYPERFECQTEYLEADYKELFMPKTKNGEFPLSARSLHIWPRGKFMMMALANLDGSFTMTLYLPKHGTKSSFDSIRSSADVEALFKEEFPDAAPLMPNYLADFQ
ncbi:MAG: FAD-dependent monooxygenase, partial [Bdellovibrionales bacterium]|nr:FAD-dependent monooxygenase [Bdellovibrionales bacterium]